MTVAADDKLKERMAELERDLAAVLNKHSCEGPSGTPDFVLAKYLMRCLLAWDEGMLRRTAWYTKNPENTEA